jgi:hypothetical protein
MTPVFQFGQALKTVSRESDAFFTKSFTDGSMSPSECVHVDGIDNGIDQLKVLQGVGLWIDIY